MAYVDLNPIRAGIAKTPEDSEFTSIYDRIRTLSADAKPTQEARAVIPLHAFSDEAEKNAPAIPYAFREGQSESTRANQSSTATISGPRLPSDRLLDRAKPPLTPILPAIRAPSPVRSSRLTELVSAPLSRVYAHRKKADAVINPMGVQSKDIPAHVRARCFFALDDLLALADGTRDAFSWTPTTNHPSRT